MTPPWLALRLVAAVIGLLFLADVLPHDRRFMDDFLLVTVHDVPRLTRSPVLVTWSLPPSGTPLRLLLNGEPIALPGEQWVDPQQVVFTLDGHPWWELRGVELLLLENQSFWLALTCAVILAASFLPAVRRRRLPRSTGVVLIAMLPAVAMLVSQAALARTWQGNVAHWAGQHYAVASTLVEHGVYGWTVEQMEGYGLQVGPDWEVKDRSQPIPTAWTYPAYTLAVAGVLSAHRVFDTDPHRERIAIFWFNIALISIGVVLTGLAVAGLGLDALSVGVLSAAFVRTGWPAASSFHIVSEPLQFAINGAALLAWSYGVRGVGLPAMLVTLGALAGLGQLAKPAVGPIVPILLAAHLLVAWRNPQRWRAALLFVVVAAIPTLVWTTRNVITVGAPVVTSTAASFFVLQGLSTNLAQPAILGRNELENEALTRLLIPPRIQQLLANPAERQALWDDKMFWFVPGVSGDSQAVNPRWVSPYASDASRNVAILGLLGLMVLALALPTPARSMSAPLIAAILISWLLLFATQALPRYFPPFTPLYVMLLAVVISGSLSRRDYRSSSIRARSAPARNANSNGAAKSSPPPSSTANVS